MITPQERLAEIVLQAINKGDIRHEQTVKGENEYGQVIIESIYEIAVYGRVQITLKCLED